MYREKDVGFLGKVLCALAFHDMKWGDVTQGVWENVKTGRIRIGLAQRGQCRRCERVVVRDVTGW
jgi:hypothetical protein